MDIKEIISNDRTAREIINDLKKKSVNVPSWEELQKQYDPKKHPVMDKEKYKDKIKKGKIEEMTRITRGWQKLAVKRMSGLIFGIPVQRVYKPQNEQEQKAAELIEAIFQKNRIDSLNRQRAKRLYACCEIVTLWYTQEQPTMYTDIQSRWKLRCKTYSPMDGDNLYPLFDEYGDLIALSVEYQRTENNITTTYFETYTADEHIRWAIDSKANATLVEEFREPISIGKITGVYIKRDEPIWENESDNIYEAEWALSRNGNYLRKNARPNWVVYSDEPIQGTGTNKDNDGIAVLQYPANAKAGYETWQQATESLKYHVDSIKQNFFMQIQLPDLSYENMKSQAMSGESRKMMFIDAQQKCLDESDIWLEGFDREINVVKAIACFMFPQYETAFKTLQVENVITPFQINDEAEKVNILTAATGGKAIMSQRTAVANLGYADNVEDELQQIANEGVNDLFNEPTM